jgi:hypothetical protein
MGAKEGSFFAGYGASDPADFGLADDEADLSLAWDAAERYGVRLLRQALPEARWVPAPVTDLSDAAARIRSAVRKRPYKQLARAAWGSTRLPADDTQLWLDAAGTMAAMRHHLDINSPSLASVSVLRPADWAGAVIGMVRSGVNSAVTAEDLVCYARESPDVADTREADEVGPAYDPFASVAEDDESLLRAFKASLLLWEAVGAISDAWWLTGLGWWGLPRALARAWNGDFDSDRADTAEVDLQQRVWPGDEPNPEDLGIRPPPLAF